MKRTELKYNMKWPELDFDKSTLNEQNFRKIYVCEFIPDERMEELIDNFEAYRKQAPASVDNKVAKTYWNQFIGWANDRGYTKADIDLAKRKSNYSGNDEHV